MQFIALLGIGLLTGVMSGIFGIGGGVVLIPMLVFFLKFPQHAANGTSLVALLLPVGLLGVLEYYGAGKITGMHVRAGLLIAVGIFCGTYVGSRFSIEVPGGLLRKSFSLLLVAIAARLFLMEPGH
jgi:uncharacterized membrane protein YfcA